MGVFLELLYTELVLKSSSTLLHLIWVTAEVSRKRADMPSSRSPSSDPAVTSPLVFPFLSVTTEHLWQRHRAISCPH